MLFPADHTLTLISSLSTVIELPDVIGTSSSLSKMD